MQISNISPKLSFITAGIKLANNITNKIYKIWFHTIKFFVEGLSSLSYKAVSTIISLVFLEGHTLVKCANYQFNKYRNQPESYGFDTILPTDYGKKPVLLIPGAIGSWKYLGDMAAFLRNQNIPVFMFNSKPGLPTEEVRANLLENVAKIQEMYAQLFHESLSKVDLVAHSMGGTLAMYSAFSPQMSHIKNGDFTYNFEHLSGQPGIGKIVTIANPTNQAELHMYKKIGKEKEIFNVIALFDAIMSKKLPALSADNSHQVCTINAGHVGIVFNSQTWEKVSNFLS